jgi:signal transduction histidine kinase
MAVVSLLVLVVGASGAWYVHSLQKRSSQILSGNVVSIIAAEELLLAVREMRYELTQFLVTSDEQHLAVALNLKDQVEKQREKAQAVAVTEKEKLLMGGINSGLRDIYESLAQLVENPVSTAARGRVGTLLEEINGGILTYAREYLNLNEKALWDSNVENQKSSALLVIGLLLLGTCGAVSGLVAGYGVARGINRSILQLTLPIRDVAGKLGQVVGPVSISADPRLEDLESVLKAVAAEVESVIERLHAREREVIRADQLAAVGQLAAGMAHELRNPLMCMKVLIQSARRGTSAGLDGRDLEVLDEEITRLEDRLQDFLDFARSTKLEKAPVDLRQVIAQTIHFLSPRAERRDIRVLDRCSPGPLSLDADEGQIRQVLLNLLLNALDAVSHGGTIEVRAYYESRRNRADHHHKHARTVALEILDDGRGLPEEHVDRIFEPFFSTKDTGLGLGLATCRRIIDLHGGEITALSRPEGGALFRVRLPADAAEPLQAPAKKTAGADLSYSTV